MPSNAAHEKRGKGLELCKRLFTLKTGRKKTTLSRLTALLSSCKPKKSRGFAPRMMGGSNERVGILGAQKTGGGSTKERKEKSFEFSHQQREGVDRQGTVASQLEAKKRKADIPHS